jgi:hypothetical protein
MNLTVTDIQSAVRSRFGNHKYDLYNSYVFNGWECDFFSVTDSGYSYEVEVKLSRGDFFADFKKEKHDLFRKIVAGQAFYFKNCGRADWHGEVIGTYKTATLEYTGGGRRFYSGRASGVFGDNTEKPLTVCEMATHLDYLNGYKNFYLHEQTHQLHAPVTRIQYVDLTRFNCPNRFYYACPEGLIKKSELPPYAGLLYVRSGYDAYTEKEAPFIHKRKQDLKAVLLDKFYWETTKLRQQIKYQKIVNES